MEMRSTALQSTDDMLIVQMEEYFKISKYLETENETEFFKQACVLFEIYIEKRYKGGKNKPSHLEKRDWFFEELSNIGITWAMSAKRFLQVLNKCRNIIMHNLEPNVKKELLREKLITELKDIFSKIMGLKNGLSDDRKEIKKQLINFGKEHAEIYNKEMFVKIKNHFGEEMNREIVTYDTHLYGIITNIYMLIDGTVKGINQASLDSNK